LGFEGKPIKIDNVYRRLVEIYAYKDVGNPITNLNLDIARLQHGNKSRERAVLDLALHLNLGIRELTEFREEGLSEEKAILKFLKGEKLRIKEDDPEIVRILSEAYRTKMLNSSAKGYVAKEKPTILWYLVPFFFSILGGIIAYVGVKNDDEGMAGNLLVFGIIMFVIDLFILWVSIPRFF
jgi:hypothetical protein